MSRPASSLPASYFEAIYQADPDPWRFASSEYEREKYRATLAALPNAVYARGLEVGCSIGVLTRQLAQRCDRLLAIDCVEPVLVEARERCAGLPGVEFVRMELPRQLPAGPFDLLMLSEVAYYWSTRDLELVAEFARQAVTPGGDIVLVHWTGVTDYPLSGDEAAQRFIDATHAFAWPLLHARAEHYRIDLLRCSQAHPPPP